MQFKDAENNRFVAVVGDGKVTFYGAGEKRLCRRDHVSERTEIMSPQPMPRLPCKRSRCNRDFNRSFCQTIWHLWNLR